MVSLSGLGSAVLPGFGERRFVRFDSMPGNYSLAGRGGSRRKLEKRGVAPQKRPGEKKDLAPYVRVGSEVCKVSES